MRAAKSFVLIVATESRLHDYRPFQMLCVVLNVRDGNQQLQEAAMDAYEKYRVAMDITQLIMMAVIGIYSWFVNRTKATKNAIEQVREENSNSIHDLQKAMHDLSGKIALLDKEISHLPGHDHLSELHEKVNAVNSALENVTGEMKSINRNLSLILESLLQGGKK